MRPSRVSHWLRITLSLSIVVYVLGRHRGRRVQRLAAARRPWNWLLMVDNRRRCRRNTVTPWPWRRRRHVDGGCVVTGRWLGCWWGSVLITHLISSHLIWPRFTRGWPGCWWAEQTRRRRTLWRLWWRQLHSLTPHHFSMHRALILARHDYNDCSISLQFSRTFKRFFFNETCVFNVFLSVWGLNARTSYDDSDSCHCLRSASWIIYQLLVSHIHSAPHCVAFTNSPAATSTHWLISHVDRSNIRSAVGMHASTCINVYTIMNRVNVSRNYKTRVHARQKFSVIKSRLKQWTGQRGVFANYCNIKQWSDAWTLLK